MRCERDAFDTLFDHAPEKLAVVKKSLITFVNKHLNKLNFEAADLGSDFKDGVFLCLLMGLLGGFFVPLHEFHLTPKDTDQMVHNVSFAFELMMDQGLKPKARPEGTPKTLKSNFITTKLSLSLTRYCQHGPEVDTARALHAVHKVPQHFLNLRECGQPWKRFSLQLSLQIKTSGKLNWYSSET